MSELQCIWYNSVDPGRPRSISIRYWSCIMHSIWLEVKWHAWNIWSFLPLYIYGWRDLSPGIFFFAKKELNESQNGERSSLPTVSDQRVSSMIPLNLLFSLPFHWYNIAFRQFQFKNLFHLGFYVTCYDLIFAVAAFLRFFDSWVTILLLLLAKHY